MLLPTEMAEIWGGRREGEVSGSEGGEGAGGEGED